MLRKTIFWIHLSCGATAGLVILMMSATGVLLTYERQMLAWSERDLYVEPPATGGSRLGVVTLLDAVHARDPGFKPTSITFRAEPGAPVSAAAGRADSRNLNPYTGELIAAGDTRLRAFFDTVKAWHRWFNVSGENRDAARAITGACNLLFLFLLLSGLYLWLPPVYNRIAFRTRLWFNAKVKTSKARDFNWHHVIGIWSVIPLVVIVATSVVFSYGWANNLVYRSVGEEPPVRGRRASPAGSTVQSSSHVVSDPIASDPGASDERLSLDELSARASALVPGWKKMTLTLPAGNAPRVEFAFDRGNGGQPQQRLDLTLDTATGAVAAMRPFSSESPGRQARSIIRFLHTGEVFGIAGQTVAGIVSLTSVVMVWTGLALAYRRLIAPLVRRRKPVRAAGKTATDSA